MFGRDTLSSIIARMGSLRPPPPAPTRVCPPLPEERVTRSKTVSGSTLGSVASAAVDLRDGERQEYHAASYRSEVGTSLGKGRAGTAIIEHVADGRAKAEGKYPRVHGYLEVIERLKEWVQRFGRRPDEIELVLSRREHLGKLKSDGQHLWLRFKESDSEQAEPAYTNLQPPSSLSTNASYAKEFTDRGAEAKLGLVTSKGVILSIHENIFALEDSPNCIPRLNYEYLHNKLENERAMEKCGRGKGTYTCAIGEHTLPGIKTLNFLEMQVWYVTPDIKNGDYASRRRRSLKPMAMPQTVDNANAEEAIRRNEPASTGYRMPDGTVWRMPQYKGPKSGGANIGTQAQSMRFLEVVREPLEQFQVTSVLNLHFSRIWGAHSKDSAATGDGEGKSFLFTALMRCSQDPSAPDVPVAPPPRDPVTLQEVMADGSRQASAKLEHGIVNQFGEGFAIVEYFSGDFAKEELSMEEQNDEFLRRIADWHRRYPNREIQETFFSMAEARFLTAGDHGYRRRLVIRFREKNFDPSMETTELPAMERITVRDHNSFEMMEENRKAFEGVEWAKNEGTAVVHYFVPPPFSGEIGVKEGLYQSLLWLRHWSRIYPDRKIVEGTNIFRWDSMASTIDSSNSFESSMFLHFEPRFPPNP